MWEGGVGELVSHTTLIPPPQQRPILTETIDILNVHLGVHHRVPVLKAVVNEGLLWTHVIALLRLVVLVQHLAGLSKAHMLWLLLAVQLVEALLDEKLALKERREALEVLLVYLAVVRVALGVDGLVGKALGRPAFDAAVVRKVRVGNALSDVLGLAPVLEILDALPREAKRLGSPASSCTR